MVLHKDLLVLLGPLKHSVHHCSSQVSLHLLLQLRQDQLLRVCWAVSKQEDGKCCFLNVLVWASRFLCWLCRHICYESTWISIKKIHAVNIVRVLCKSLEPPSFLMLCFQRAGPPEVFHSLSVQALHPTLSEQWSHLTLTYESETIKEPNWRHDTHRCLALHRTASGHWAGVTLIW